MNFIPTRKRVSRKQNHVLKLSKDGFRDETIFLQSKMGAAILGNAIVGGPIGAGVDLLSGAAYYINPEEIKVNLIRSDLYPSEEN